MASEREQRRQAYVEKTRSEVASLVERGVRMGGNAFSPVLLAKGELTPDKRLWHWGRMCKKARRF